MLALTTLAVAAAACSSGGGLPAAGHGSPAAAASGFIQGLEAGSTSQTCGYVAPDEAAACNSTLGSVSAPQHSGVSIGNTFTDGDQAIVAIVATKLCSEANSNSTTSTSCFSNSNASAGLPGSDSDFQSAMSNVFSNSNTPDLVTTQVSGSWYVQLAPSSTGTTGTTGTGTTGTSTTGTSTTGTTGTSTTGTTGTSTTGSTGTGTTGT